MSSSAQSIRAYTGPPILSFGFRPFFLASAIWAALAVVLWVLMLSGMISLPTAFSPLEWHVHELLYGFLPAVAGGFLLTAIPNWTGRLPMLGAPLFRLFMVWIAGRAAVLTSEFTGFWFAATVDLAFLTVLLGTLAREIIAGRNTKNLRVLALVGLLLAGNVIYFVEAATGSGTGYGTRIGIAAVVLLISLIGGRIIPSFTRNWLANRAPGRLPNPFDTYDVVTLAVGVGAFVLWIAAPFEPVTAVVLLAAGVLHAFRLVRWAGERTAPERLVLVLHVAYAFVPLGFFVVGLSILAPHIIATSGAVHAWTVGAMGMMTLAVMTRASLGHTGRSLKAAWPTTAIYGAAFVAVLSRLAAAFGIAYTPMLYVSATAWIFAFGGFAVVYWPALTQSRVQTSR